MAGDAAQEGEGKHGPAPLDEAARDVERTSPTPDHHSGIAAGERLSPPCLDAVCRNPARRRRSVTGQRQSTAPENVHTAERNLNERTGNRLPALGAGCAEGIRSPLVDAGGVARDHPESRFRERGAEHPRDAPLGRARPSGAGDENGLGWRLRHAIDLHPNLLRSFEF